MTKACERKRHETLPFYIEKVNHIPELDGYTWKELAQGYYGDCNPLPCPRCGHHEWGIEECVFDHEPYPTIERALKGVSRKGLIGLIKKLAIRTR